jgi:hypothetical protein
MKTALVVVVVLLVLVTGIPLGLMHASGCPQCHLSDGAMRLGACAAILVVFLVLVGTLERRLISVGPPRRGLLIPLALERPPQS